LKQSINIAKRMIKCSEQHSKDIKFKEYSFRYLQSIVFYVVDQSGLQSID